MVENFYSKVEHYEKTPEEKALDRINALRNRTDSLGSTNFNYKNEKGHDCWLFSESKSLSFFERDRKGVVSERTLEYRGKERGFELFTRSHGDDGVKVLSREKVSMEKVNEEIDNFEKELEKWELQKLESEVKK